jgi:hypothetical protein
LQNCRRNRSRRRNFNGHLNDEYQMTNDECLTRSLRDLCFVIDSSFDIRASSF